MAEKLIITDTKLTAIGDAIRTASNTTDLIKLDNMPSKIAALSSQDATASENDILSGKTAYVKGTKLYGTIAKKTSGDITLSENIVSFPAGYYSEAMSKAVPSVAQSTPAVSIDTSTGIVTASSTQNAGYVAKGTTTKTLQLPKKAATTYTPTTSNQTISSGLYLTGTQTIKGDANLKAANIKKGTSIFGVSGTCNEGINPSGSLSITTNGTHDVTSVASAVVNVPIPSGYVKPSGNKSITSTASTDVTNYATAQVSDANLVAANIKKGKTILGVEGTCNEGINPSGNINITGTSAVNVTNYATAQVSDTNLKAENIRYGSKVLGIEGTFSLVNSMLEGAYEYDVKEGLKFYKNGKEFVGTAPNITSSDVKVTKNVVTCPYGHYASDITKTISTGSATTPATTITANPTISINSSGLISASSSTTKSVTPSVTEGYVSSGTAGTITVSGSATKQLTTKGATTYTPKTTSQTIASGTYLTGTQTISGDANLVASNIKSGVSIFGVSGSYTGTLYNVEEWLDNLTMTFTKTGTYSWNNGINITATSYEAMPFIMGGTITAGSQTVTFSYLYTEGFASIVIVDKYIIIVGSYGDFLLTRKLNSAITKFEIKCSSDDESDTFEYDIARF